MTIDPEVNAKLRAMAHDLSNSIETIMQASYLLSQAKLEEPARKWVAMIASATSEAARLNGAIREILRAQAAPAPKTGKAKVSKSRSNSGRSRKSGT